MKNKYLLPICIMLGVALFISAFTAISVSPQRAHATIANGTPQFGGTQLVLSVGTAATSSSALNLSGSGASAGPSVPCYAMKLGLVTTSGTACTSQLYMGGSSTTCTVPLYATSTSGTAGTQFVDLPQATNVNQLWFKLTTSATGTYTSGGGTISAIYTQ